MSPLTDSSSKWSLSLSLPPFNLSLPIFQFFFSVSVVKFVNFERNRLTLSCQVTLVDLLGVAGRRSGLPMVVCCSSRDELDAVCSAVSDLPYISLASLVLKFFAPFFKGFLIVFLILKFNVFDSNNLISRRELFLYGVQCGLFLCISVNFLDL